MRSGPVCWGMVLAVLAFVLLMPTVGRRMTVYAQGNTISGFVWGINRQPVPDVTVELQNDYYTTIQRTRSSNSGGYQFYNVPGGRLRIRVTPYGTDYDEQTKDIEIVNLARDNGAGGLRRSGFSNEKHDFYLRLKKGSEGLANAGILFAQEIPKDARKLYDKAVEDLDNKKEKEGLAGLRSALEIFPKYYSALNRLGSEYVRLGHFGVAEILLALAVEVNPRSYSSWYGLAYSRFSLKNYAAALASANKAAELAPTAPENLVLKGVILRSTKQYAEAEKILTNAKNLEGVSPRVHWELALLYAHNLQRYGEAATELKAFLKAQPDAKNSAEIRKLIADFESKAKS